MTEPVLLLGAIAGALVAIGVALRKGYRVVSEFFSMQAVAARLISAEMRPNGGSTLLDKVNKIAPYHKEAEEHWTALRKSHADVAEKLETNQKEVAKRLEKIEQTIATPKEFP